MSDRSPQEEFADANEAVGEEWEAETTPYERIRHVVAHTYSPVSADAVADDARIAPKTARKHLNTLADEGFVETTPGEQGGTLYRRSPESLVVERAADILEHVSTDELVTRIQEMREQLPEYRSEFGVDTPEELAVNQTNQAFSETESLQDEINPETIRDVLEEMEPLATAELDDYLHPSVLEVVLDDGLCGADEGRIAPSGRHEMITNSTSRIRRA